jgi:subtilisin family serine protease
VNNSSKPIAALLLVLAAVPAAVASASGNSCKAQGQGIDRCLMLRAPAGMIPALAAQHGLTVIEPLSSVDPNSFLVEVSPSASRQAVVAALLQNPDVVHAEPVVAASLTEHGPDMSPAAAVLDAPPALTLPGTWEGDESLFFSDAPWSGYLGQPAVTQVELDLARDPQVLESYGTGIVAVIDTGVDPYHPMLQGSLVPGYDFLLDEAGIASEWNALDAEHRDQTRDDFETIADQSYAGILEGGGVAVVANDSTRVIVDQSYAGILEQSYAGILEQSYAGILEGAEIPAAFGHGTMVAGLVRLVAPGALIMPLRAFDGDGTGSTADVVEAVYFAIEQGADVINMSFSMDESSAELTRAITLAKQAGIVCVSSAGNQGSASLTYPAALTQVIGVASTDAEDRLSSFSSYGSAMVVLGAPGEGLVSLYPGGLYAGGWGTSFSSALVSGTVALLHSVTGNDTLVTVNFGKAVQALASSADDPDPSVPGGALGAGRLDVRGAFAQGLSNNGNGH